MQNVVGLLMVCLALGAAAQATPPVTTNLVLQLDGSDVTSVPYNGRTVVSSWNDQASAYAGANHATQATTARMPKLVDNWPASQGHPVLLFDGTDDELVISDHAMLDPGAGPFTVFVVGMVHDDYMRWWLRKGNNWSGDEGWSIWSDDHDRIVLRANAEGINDDLHKVGKYRDQRVARNISVYHSLTVITMEFAGSNMSLRGYVNGIDSDWGSWYDGWYSGAIETGDNLLVGPDFYGYLAEVLIYDTRLSSADRNAVVTYLTDKYALPTEENDILADYYAAGDRAAYLANLTPGQEDLLTHGEAQGLLSMRPLYVPSQGDHLRPGWPVAVRDGDDVALFFRNDLMMRSADTGATWSAPVDITQYLTPPNTAEVKSAMQAVGMTAMGEMILVDMNGVMTSSNGGLSWSHHFGAFTATQLSGPQLNNGPKIIQHPYWGLAAFPNSIDDVLWIRYSQDNGRTWQETSTPLPVDIAKSAESCAIEYNGGIILLGRCHSQDSYEAGPGDPDLGTYRYVQLWSADGQFPFEVALTNMRATGTSWGAGMWGQDTVDLALNPVTGRLEAVVTNRNGGGPGNEMDLSVQTLNLWSIDPDDLMAGSAAWRSEGTLLERHKYQGLLEVEGMHPAAAVIDAEAGVQHVFLYLGMHDLVYGVFQLTRTLDTPGLSTFLQSEAPCWYDGPHAEAADINGDCVIDIEDFALLAGSWLERFDPRD